MMSRGLSAVFTPPKLIVAAVEPGLRRVGLIKFAQCRLVGMKF